jgi:hypothetical protein
MAGSYSKHLTELLPFDLSAMGRVHSEDQKETRLEMFYQDFLA